MVEKPTSIKLEESDLLRIKELAKAEDISVSKLLKRTIRNNLDLNSVIVNNLDNIQKKEIIKLDDVKIYNQEEKRNILRDVFTGEHKTEEIKKEEPLQSHETIKEQQILRESIKPIFKHLEVKQPEHLQKIKNPEVIIPDIKVDIKTEQDKKQNKQEVIMSGEIDEKIRKAMESSDLKKVIANINLKIDKIDDRVCKDGDCTKNELASIKKQVEGLNELKELKKSTDEIGNIKKNIEELHKHVSKQKFRCDRCGNEILEPGDSFCRNCGLGINSWDEVPNWKPYNERVKK